MPGAILLIGLHRFFEIRRSASGVTPGRRAFDIRALPDLPALDPAVPSPTMKLKPLPPAERLSLLQNADHWRDWKSVDDKRTCVICGNRLTGRKIAIICGKGGHFLIRCPTPGCAGTLRDFALPGNPLVEPAAWRDWLRSIDDDSGPVMT
jgi:hypothetical protein